MSANAIPQVEVSTLADDEVLLDVREPNEYEAGHAPGAVSIPLGELRARAPEAAALGDTVTVICKLGGRSQKAAEFLATQGVTTRNVTGGTTAWADAGKTLVSETDAEAAVVAPSTPPPAAI